MDFYELRNLFHIAYRKFGGEGYWDEGFGFSCVDSGFLAGTAGEDVSDYVVLHTRNDLWPISKKIDDYDENGLFDMIEFLFDHVSKPLSGWMHSFCNCGMHWETFDQAAGQEEYRQVMSDLLEGYGSGYRMNERGEIMELAPHGMGKLLTAKPPTKDQKLMARLNAAIDQFQRYGVSIDDRRHAVADLAAVLEKLRPQVKEHLLTQDEKDLFTIANQFGIRHFNDKQRTEYDAVWLSWMFHVFLAAIHTSLHLVKRQAKAS